MGGKHKVANRTKNNARPSSTGRSAELLGSSMPQFIGFLGTSKDSPEDSFSVVQENALLDNSSLDVPFQLALKKVMKKDSKTKLKGLQELVALVKEAEADSVKMLLPLWPRLYNTLATDTDNRVREAAHMVHHKIVVKVKRNIAPYLKQLMAPWFTSQYDNYAPAASVALQAFKDTFPPNKFQEAIIFCQTEILNYIHDNLLVQSAQSLSSTQNMTKEEAEAKYERVLLACLQGYALYLEKVPEEQIQQVSSLNNTIIQSSKFWKLSTHSSAPIRGAWFKVLARVCEKAVFLLETKKGEATKTVLGNLHDMEPTVLPFVWEAALLIISSVPEWWDFINVEKVYLSNLWTVLKQAGHGNASVIYPHLLPILSHLPPSVQKDKFYPMFFSNLQLGLKQKTVIASRRESLAVSTALIECLQFVMVQNQSDSILCKQLIKNYLITTIDICLVEPNMTYKAIFNQIALLVRYLSRNSQYHEYLNFFFDQTTALFQISLTEDEKYKELDLNGLASKQIQCLRSLKDIKPKKNFNVKFVGSSENLFVDSIQHIESVVEGEEEFLLRLNSFVGKLFEAYIACINQRKEKSLMLCLCELLSDFNSQDLEKLLVGKRKVCPKTDLMDLFEGVLLKWLQDEELCCKDVMDLISLVTEFFDDAGKKEIFSKLSKVVEGESFGWCISMALSYPYISLDFVKSWLKSDQVSDFFVSIAEKEIEGDCPEELSQLFKLGLIESNELYIDDKAITRIVEKFVVSLETPLENRLIWENCASLSTGLALAIYTEDLLLKYGNDLLLALFKFSCKHFKEESDDEACGILWEVNTSLEDVISLLTKDLPEGLFEELIEQFSEIIQNEFKSIELSDIAEYSVVVSNLLRAIYQNGSYLNFHKVLDFILRHKSCDSIKEQIVNLCSISKYLEGSSYSLRQEMQESEIPLQENILLYFSWSYLKLEVLSADATLVDMTQDDWLTKNKESFLKILPENSTILPEVFEDLNLCRILLQRYRNVKMNQGLGILKESIQNCLEKLKCDSKNTNLTTHDTPGISELTEDILKSFSEKMSYEFLLDDTNISAEKSLEIVKIIKLCEEVVSEKLNVLSRQHWDFIVLSLSVWTTNCVKYRTKFELVQVQAFLIRVVKLFCKISSKINQLKEEEASNQFVSEWKDLFEEPTQSDLVKVWFYLAEKFKTKKVNLSHLPLLQEFGNLLNYLNSELLTNHNDLLQISCDLLILNELTLQIWGHKMLLVLVPGLVKIDEEIFAPETPNSKGIVFEQFKEKLDQTADFVNTMLEDFKLGDDSCRVAPFTDCFTYTCAYLLLWDILLNLCEQASAEVRFQYVDWIRNHDLLKNFLNNVFRLMPSEILYNMECKENHPVGQFFLKKPDFTNDISASSHIEELVCYLFTCTLAQLPVLSRQWWGNLNSRVSRIVEKVTTTFVSPRLCKKELTDVTKHQAKFKNLVVKVIPVVREVQAIYTVDDTEMELVIVLPSNYPLEGPQVNCNRHIGGTTHKQWLLQLRKCLLHQNGHIWDGLTLWNHNLDKKFDGVEECYICFALLHPGTYQLPKLSCHTCKKKFHSACLYKWFSTSNKSSCPICRNLF